MSAIKQEIIKPAWELINSDTKVKIFYFLPGVISVLFFFMVLVYQIIYTLLVLWNIQIDFLNIFLTIFENILIRNIIIVVAIIFSFIYFILLPIFEAWLIEYIHLKSTDSNASLSDSLWKWWYNFIPMFEYNNFFSFFSVINVLNSYLFCLRFIGLDYILATTIVFIFLILFAIFVNFLGSYTKYTVTLEDEKIWESFVKSRRITILNLSNTLKLYFYMFQGNFKVFLNIFFIWIFPFVAIIILWLIAQQVVLFYIVLIISIIIWVLLLVWLWYLVSVLEVFKTSIWYYAYKKWILKTDK